MVAPVLSRLTLQERNMWARILVAVPILMICVLNVLDFALIQSSIFESSNRSTGNGSRRRTQGVNGYTDVKSQMVDIISVGSLLKSSYQDAQQRTFGGHESVRNFFRVTEASDGDQECFMKLATEELEEVITFCDEEKETESVIAAQFRTKLFRPKKHTGWMCAQKRPIDGLNYVLNQYRKGLAIPQYLAIIDDDTYINMDSVTDILLKDFPVHSPQLAAGCNFDYLTKTGFTFPYGGFGSFITRTAIERLLKPIDCSIIKADAFTKHACWRLRENNMGEERFFEDGMSVGDLMFRFASEQPFGDVSNWKQGGYCMHSDHALAYFLNFYFIAVPDDVLLAYVQKPTDELRRTFGYTALTSARYPGRQGECANEKDVCTIHHHICHYILPAQMDKLYRDYDEKTRSLDAVSFA
jgi:hypothetical protein